jgi:hypothetical protein
VVKAGKEVVANPGLGVGLVCWPENRLLAGDEPTGCSIAISENNYLISLQKAMQRLPTRVFDILGIFSHFFQTY